MRKMIRTKIPIVNKIDAMNLTIGCLLKIVSTNEKTMEIKPDVKTSSGGKKRKTGIVLKINPIFNKYTPSTLMVCSWR